MAFDALILAGGSGRRLGGVDKPALQVGGRPLLDRVLAATQGAARTVVVGPSRRTSRAVLWCREEPAGAGPVAALRTGLELVTAPVVVLLAVDLPFLTSELVAALVQRIDPDGAVLVDGGGREQYLCSAWSSEALRQADLHVDRMQDVVRQVGFARLQVPAEPGRPAPWTDIDTPEDLAAVSLLERP